MVWSHRRLFVTFGFLFSRAYAFQAGGHLPVSHLCGRSLQHRLESSSPQQLQDIGSDALRLPLQDLNAQEIEFLNTVKKQIHEVPNLIEKAETSGAHLDDFFIWRYMKSHGDLDNTNSVISLISETVEWRLEQLHGFLDNEALALELAEKKMYVSGKDKNGRPLIHIHFGKGPLNTEVALSSLLYTLEQAIASMDGVGQFTVLVNCHNFKQSHLPSVETMKKWIIFVKDHYPCLLGRLLVLNVNPFLRMTWKALSYMLKPSTRQKVQLLSKKELPILKEYLDENQYAEYISRH